MSTDTNLKRASTLRSSIALARCSQFAGAAEDDSGPGSTATEDGRESRGSPPVGYAHRSTNSTRESQDQILQLKGFVGGVPLNTETAAVKPRVGIE